MFCLVIVIVHFLLCLIYELHFAIGTYIAYKNHSIYRARYCLWFQAATGALRTSLAGYGGTVLTRETSEQDGKMLRFISEEKYYYKRTKLEEKSGDR